MNSLVVIPARMSSSRLPGKPLIDLKGKSLIQRTYEQCIKAIPADKVLVATDHIRIYEHCLEKGMNVAMTSDNCLTGTDRVAEVAKSYEADVYINVQGDEPLFNPTDILKVLSAVKQYPGELINGYAGFFEESLYRSTSIPKVVFRPDGRLLYMSRAAIPANKQGTFKTSYRQVCVYAFPRKALIDFNSPINKTPLEAYEDIEILRFLELGYEVRMIELSSDSVAVDTAEDVVKVLKILNDEK